MKKIYLLVLSAALFAAGGVSGSAQSLQKVSPNLDKLSQILKQKHSAKGGTTLKMHPQTTNQFVSLPNLLKKAGSASVDTIITNAPKGTVVSDGIRDGFNIYSNSFGAYYGNYSSSVGYYVVTDDAIYLKDPFVGFATDSYIKLVKGEKEGEYYAQLPQPVYSQPVHYSDGSYSTNVYYAAHVNYEEDDQGYLTYVVDSTAEGSKAYFTYENGELASSDRIINDQGFPKSGIGLVNSKGNWEYFLDANTTIAPNTYTKAVLPSNAKISKYELTRDDESLYIYPDNPENNLTFVDSTTSLVSVAIDGNDIYVNNPLTNDPGSWIKGTIADGKATFLPQYIGIDTQNNIHEWFQPGKYKILKDSSYLDYYGVILGIRDHYLSDKLELAYNSDANEYQSPDSTSLIINGSPSSLYTVRTFDNIKLTHWEETAATPADPEITQVIDYNDESRYGFAVINIPNVDTTGKLLDESKIYYNLFIGDDVDNPVSLNADDGYEYYNGPDPVNIPYSYSDGYDISASGASHRWYFYFDSNSVDSIGVQVFYTGAGETRSSNKVWFDLRPQHSANGINTISGNSSSLKSEAYFDLSGRQISAPKQAGIYIKESTFTDGTKKSIKFIKK